VRNATGSAFKGINVGQVAKSQRYSSKPHDRRPSLLRGVLENCKNWSSASRASPADEIGGPTASVLLSCPLMSPTPQKRHENDQSNDRDNDNHNLHFWILETLICDHKCSGSVALTGAKCHDPLDANVRSTQ
jgi:hypothetical protein